MSDTALLVIDVQEPFRHAPYWSEADLVPFMGRLQALVDGAVARSVPVLQVFHVSPTAHFSQASGHVRTLTPLAIQPDAVFHKTRHSALIGTGLDTWLVLDGYACTTHHASCARLAEAAPRARVLENRLFVEDRDRFTSAGVTAGVDLMLHLVERWAGPAAALAAARTLVVYMRREAQDPQLLPWLEGRSHLHPVVHRAQDAIAADPGRNWSLAELGRASGASGRNLSRLFATHAGMTVTDAVSRHRVALARALVEQTGLGLEEVAARAGFRSARQMRRVWRQFHPVAPSGMRGVGRS